MRLPRCLPSLVAIRRAPGAAIHRHEGDAAALPLPVSALTTPCTLYDAEELGALFTAAAFEKVGVFHESVTVRFYEPERFVPLVFMSSAAVMPAFTQLEARARKALLETVCAGVESTVRRYRDADPVTFPMRTHVARAIA